MKLKKKKVFHFPKKKFIKYSQKIFIKDKKNMFLICLWSYHYWFLHLTFKCPIFQTFDQGPNQIWHSLRDFKYWLRWNIDLTKTSTPPASGIPWGTSNIDSVKTINCAKLHYPKGPASNICWKYLIVVYCEALFKYFRVVTMSVSLP